MKKQKMWMQNKEIFYLCKKCNGWFLLENFNLKKQKCKSCVQKLKIKEVSSEDKKVIN